MEYLKKLEAIIYDEVTPFLDERYGTLFIDLLKRLATFGNQYCLIMPFYPFKALDFSGFKVISH